MRLLKATNQLFANQIDVVLYDFMECCDHVRSFGFSRFFSAVSVCCLHVSYYRTWQRADNAGITGMIESDESGFI